jgi:hypothetical protein
MRTFLFSFGGFLGGFESVGFGKETACLLLEAHAVFVAFVCVRVGSTPCEVIAATFADHATKDGTGV